MKLLFTILLWSISVSSAQELLYELQLSPLCPPITLANVPFSCTVELSWHWPDFTVSPIANLTYEVLENETLLASGSLSPLNDDGSLLSIFEVDDLVVNSYGRTPFTFNIHSHLPNNTIYLSSETITIRTIPGILSLSSPAIMMLIAALTHEVIPALFCGIWVASTFVNFYNPLLGLLRAFDTYIPGSIQDEDNAAILFFVLLLGGMVGVLHDAGAVQSLARVASRWATSSKRGQYAVVLVAVFNFFDDYTNTLITGNSMQALADKVKISRSKLAFIVDTTASPFASLVPVSSWIGFQVGLIAEAFQEIGIKRDPYMTLIVSIPYRFYPIGLVLFLCMNITLMREYGPMWKKEREAREKETGTLSVASSSDVLPLEDNSVTENQENEIVREIIQEQNERLGVKAFIAAFSIMGTVIIVISGLFIQGYLTLQQMRAEGDMVPITARAMISNSNSLQALLWGCGSGTIITLVLVIGFRVLSFKKSMEAWNQGTMSVLSAVIVLIFAWGMGKAIEDSRAVDFVINFIGSSLNPKLVPFIVVVISGGLTAATGASWGVMVILFPLAVPLAHSLAPGNDDILINTIGGILGGSMLGDHCSPIADTTILAATSSGCSLLDHYKTQLPYVLTVGLITPIFGHLMTGLGLYPPLVGIVINLLFCVGILLLFGRKIRPVDGDTRSNFQRLWERLASKRNHQISETTPLTAK